MEDKMNLIRVVILGITEVIIKVAQFIGKFDLL